MAKLIVIQGEKGSGKTLLAKFLAAKLGKFCVESADAIDHPFALSRVSSVPVDTVVIEEYDELDVSKFKALIDCGELEVHLVMRPSIKVKTPNFIVVMKSGISLRGDFITIDTSEFGSDEFLCQFGSRMTKEELAENILISKEV